MAMIQYDLWNNCSNQCDFCLIYRKRILNKEEMDMIINWLPRKPNKITLLMNSNIDGDSTKIFMDKCKGKCRWVVKMLKNDAK